MMRDVRRIADFQQQVWAYYRQHGRHDLPWRQPLPSGAFDPYRILVSEMMLQQTQVPRVIPKFELFMEHFPNFETLATAPLAAVIMAWSGLGYNRRAKFLWEAARLVAANYGGRLPRTSAELVRLPGIGPNTAGALLAYAFNLPVVFIETNIRTVFIHHFFADQTDVADGSILDLVARSLPAHEPEQSDGAGQARAQHAPNGQADAGPSPARRWYWALMDYGTHLKQSVGNLNVLSKHYTKQSAFAGSRRQVRGQVLRLLGARHLTPQALAQHITDGSLGGVLDDLLREGFIQRADGYIKLADE